MAAKNMAIKSEKADKVQELETLNQATLSRKYRLTLLEPMLGTVPTSKHLFTNYPAAKAGLELEEVAEEADMVPEPEDGSGKPGYTSFYSDADGIYLFDYHVKGFLKEAGQVLKDVLGVRALRSKLDNFLFVEPRYIYLQEKPDGTLERPLRGQTAQGPRGHPGQERLCQSRPPLHGNHHPAETPGAQLQEDQAAAGLWQAQGPGPVPQRLLRPVLLGAGWLTIAKVQRILVTATQRRARQSAEARRGVIWRGRSKARRTAARAERG